MYYLIATILLNVVISVILKQFARFKINALQAIVANYWVCVITGSLFIGRTPFTSVAVSAPWFPWALMMGAGFICVFNLIAYCTRVDGITTATVANKLSLIIPVLFSLFLYSEHISIGKGLGIILAFPAVYLTTRVKDEENKVQNFLWPALLFLGSGMLDTLVKFVQIRFLPESDVQALFTTCCFAAAGTIGVIVVTTLLILKKQTFQWRNIIAGICVGIPNYFSIYYLIRMLHSGVLQSSAAIPVNNIGILVVSSLVAILFFKERANTLRIIGLVLSILAILLIAFGDVYGGHV